MHFKCDKRELKVLSRYNTSFTNAHFPVPQYSEIDPIHDLTNTCSSAALFSRQNNLVACCFTDKGMGKVSANVLVDGGIVGLPPMKLYLLMYSLIFWLFF
jgi:hypothetical protein